MPPADKKALALKLIQSGVNLDSKVPELSRVRALKEVVVDGMIFACACHVVGHQLNIFGYPQPP